MAGSSLLLLLDDIAAVLDDIAVMTKVATKKTAGVLGDDLALNAQQVAGVKPQRELPVIWAVAKGSVVNKLILVPLAIVISYFANWAVTPLLAIGGLFLCFEGFEKILHKLLHSNKKESVESHKAHILALSDPSVDLVSIEKSKIKGAVRTDFILSAEIIVISLVTVAQKPIGIQLAVLTAISALMTVFIYGLVACIVKIDDLGMYLLKSESSTFVSKVKTFLGKCLLRLSPLLMHVLSILGTAAMFLVGGGIIAHAIPYLEHLAHKFSAYLASIEGTFGGMLNFLGPIFLNGLIGVIAGGLVVAVIQAFKKLKKTVSNAQS